MIFTTKGVELAEKQCTAMAGIFPTRFWKLCGELRSLTSIYMYISNIWSEWWGLFRKFAIVEATLMPQTQVTGALFPFSDNKILIQER